MIGKNGKPILVSTGPRYQRCYGADSIGAIATVDYILGCANNSALTTTAGQTLIPWAYQFIAPSWKATLARIAVEVVTLGSATKLKFGVYSSLEDAWNGIGPVLGLPYKLLYDSGDITPAAGINSCAPALVLTPGLRYWITWFYDVGPTSVRAMTASSQNEFQGISDNDVATPVGKLRGPTLDAWPSALPALFWPIIGMRAGSSAQEVGRIQFS